MQFGISGRSPTNLTQLKASITELLELLCDKISTLCQEKKHNRKIKKKTRQTQQTHQVRVASQQICFMT